MRLFQCTYCNVKAPGQTILEVLVALSAAIVILSAITVIVLTSLNQSTTNQKQSLATQYAQEGMEYLKNDADTLTTGRSYEMDQNNIPIAGNCTTANVGEFKRCVDVQSNPTDCGTLRKVTVSVSWTDGTCANSSFCHTVPIVSCL